LKKKKKIKPSSDTTWSE